MKKPSTTWTSFLMSAPYFTGAIMDAVIDDDLPDYADLVRAVFYYDLFDGEVSNGGVMQYFFNQALDLPDFEKAASIVERHPVLVEGAAFMNEVHAAWDSVKDRVMQARDAYTWPEDLFRDNQFTALEERFFAANHAIRMKLYVAICAAPEDYLEIVPEARDAAYRFENGFPIGPNVLQTERGTSIVWFTPDRMHLEVERSDFSNDGGRTRDWVDFRTGASGTRRFKKGQLVSHETQKALWQRHGLAEHFDSDGSVTSTALSLNGKELVSTYATGVRLADTKTLEQILKTSKDYGY